MSMKHTAAAQKPAVPIGFTEFVALVAAMMACQAIAIDAMLPAFPVIVRALHVADENHGQWVLTAYMAGLGCGQLFWGVVLRPVRPEAGAALRARDVCGRGSVMRSVGQLRGAARVALHPRTGRRQRHGVALGDSRPVFRPRHGARHVADIRRVPDGARDRAQPGAADPADRALALYLHPRRRVRVDRLGLGLAAIAGDAPSGVSDDADRQPHRRRRTLGVEQSYFPVLHAGADRHVRIHHGVCRHGAADLRRCLSPPPLDAEHVCTVRHHHGPSRHS